MLLRLLRVLFLLMASVHLGNALAYSESLYNIGAGIERSLSGLKARKVRVGGASFAYLERADHGETLVLLHGFGTNKDSWLRFVRHLPRQYRILVIDLPGHGDSHFDVESSYAAPALAEQIISILSALDVQTFHLVGHSLGGWVSVLLAAKQPDAVLSLTLMDSAGLVPPLTSDFQHALARGENPLLVGEIEDFDHLLDYVFHKRPMIPWPGKTVLAQQFVARAERNKKIWRDLEHNPKEVTASLGSIKSPVLVLWGENDRIIDKSVVARFIRLVPQAISVMISGCGHSPMTERPRETALYVQQFLLNPASVPNFDPSTIAPTSVELPRR